MMLLTSYTYTHIYVCMHTYIQKKEGKITIDGHDLRDVSLDSLRQNIGVVPQDTVLFNESIFYNINYGNLRASREEVEDAAR